MVMVSVVLLQQHIGGVLISEPVVSVMSGERPIYSCRFSIIRSN